MLQGEEAAEEKVEEELEVTTMLCTKTDDDNDDIYCRSVTSEHHEIYIDLDRNVFCLVILNQTNKSNYKAFYALSAWERIMQILLILTGFHLKLLDR
jgi:hypothetical protein